MSEQDIGPAIDTVFRTSPRRIIVSSFASHVHRIQQVLEAAIRHNRKVAFVGRSMVRNMGIAKDLGYLDIPDGLIVDMKTLEKLPDDQVVLICTGSQGEPLAALSRMANREHIIKIGEGDTVLLASSLIPGNENAIYRLINGLIRWGANVVHKGNAKVHVSGHASAGELVYCYNIVKPTNVLPVHGEWRHLKANAALAVKTGVEEDRVLVIEDGVVVDLIDGRASIAGRIKADYVFVSGMTVGGASHEALDDRRKLAEDGTITVLGILDTRTGKLAEPIEFFSRGFVQDTDWMAGAGTAIADAMKVANDKKKLDGPELERLITRTMSRWLQRRFRRSPIITSIVVDS
jgi:ribonuclease J